MKLCVDITHAKSCNVTLPISAIYSFEIKYNRIYIKSNKIDNESDKFGLLWRLASNSLTSFVHYSLDINGHFERLTCRRILA